MDKRMSRRIYGRVNRWVADRRLAKEMEKGLVEGWVEG
jgi:hypothetical protein